MKKRGGSMCKSVNEYFSAKRGRIFQEMIKSSQTQKNRNGVMSNSNSRFYIGNWWINTGT